VCRACTTRGTNPRVVRRPRARAARPPGGREEGSNPDSVRFQFPVGPGRFAEKCRCTHVAGYVGLCTYNGWMLKRCRKCRAEKRAEEFHRNAANPDGRHDWCKECKNAWKRGRSPEAKRAERLRWKAANPEKKLAHKALQKAVARGTLVRPEACERCGSEGSVQGHHPDYERRFEVVWLCPSCHGEEHAGWSWPVAA
jgi:hypothetical protein